MDSLFPLGMATMVTIVIVISICFVLMVSLPFWWMHRREMARLNISSSREKGKLEARIEALEERCAKLEERVTDAHLLLADEQRQLDRRLKSILPQEPLSVPGDGEPEPTGRRRGEHGLARE